jgi:hypothetical protein
MDITLIVSSVLKDASVTTIGDTTTYADRSAFYSTFYAYKVDEDDQETAIANIDQGDPSSVLTWAVATDVDGHYRFKNLLYPIWDGGEGYVTDDVVYYSGVYYTAIQDNSNQQPDISIGTNWAVHTPTVVDEDISNMEVGVLDCILFYRLKTCFSQEVAVVSKTLTPYEAVDFRTPAQLQTYERYGVLIDGIAVDNYQQRFAEGEKKVLYMTKLC